MRTTWGSVRIELLQGDLTQQNIDAIVNAANSKLAGGGGVDGAIHRAAGPAVMEETNRRYPEGCPTGQAVASAAGDLPAQYIIHTVGPVWKDGKSGEEELLKSAVSRCLELAEEHRCRGIAFPAISTGVYGYPLDHAARAMLTTIVETVPSLETLVEIRLVLFDERAYNEFAKVLETLETDQRKRES